MLGLSHFSALDPLIDGAPGLIDVLEIEPQTLWYQPDPRRRDFRVDERTVEALRARPLPKILHSVAAPVGGTHPPPDGQLRALKETIAALSPSWVSEHLSFNCAGGSGGRFNTGFLLPPRQTPAGVECAARSIRSMMDRLATPFAVETGVNYLRPRDDELPDGAFVGEVSERADCGLLLDLHNLWCNERNGRQRIVDFLAQLPLERVWEVHLAGGSSVGGYWVDSHAGAVPRELLAIAGQVLPRLPNLRAVVFELFPDYLPRFGIEAVANELRMLRALVPRRDGAIEPVSTPRSATPPSMWVDPGGPSPADWENALGALVVSKPADGRVAAALEVDPGLAVLRKLVGDFRASMVAGVLKLTMRLLLLSFGDRIDAVLEGYGRDTHPELFASAEATTFAAYLRRLQLPLPYWQDVLAFEEAVMLTLLDGRNRIVPFSADPLPLLRALAEGRRPDGVRSGHFEVEVTPETVATHVS